MLSARAEERAEMLATALIHPLTAVDIPALEKLEAATRLAFWGREHYRKFLEEYPEYFGAKSVLAPEIGSTKLVGFILSRSIFDNLEILKVGVHPDHHRRGIGTILIQSAFEEGLRRGCRRCFLEVRSPIWEPLSSTTGTTSGWQGAGLIITPIPSKTPGSWSARS